MQAYLSLTIKYNKGYGECQVFHCSNIKATPYHNDPDLEIWERSEHEAEYVSCQNAQSENDIAMSSGMELD